MVDVTFRSRAKHFIPLSLLKYLASLSSSSSSVADPPEDMAYIGKEGMKAIKGKPANTDIPHLELFIKSRRRRHGPPQSWTVERPTTGRKNLGYHGIAS